MTQSNQDVPNNSRNQHGIDSPLPNKIIDSEPLITRVRKAQVNSTDNWARVNIAEAQDMWSLTQGEKVTVEVHTDFVVIYPTTSGGE